MAAETKLHRMLQARGCRNSRPRRWESRHLHSDERSYDLNCCAGPVRPISLPQAAWQVVDGALWTVGLGKEDELVAFCAADVLLTKVRRDYRQVPAESRVAFRDSVLALVKKFVPSGDGAIHPAFHRLCLAVAALAVQMSEWVDVVDTLVRLVGTDPASLPSTFQILALLPEEVRRRLCCLLFFCVGRCVSRQPRWVGPWRRY